MHLPRRFLTFFALFFVSAHALRSATAAQAYLIADAQTGYILEEQEPRKKLQVGSLIIFADAAGYTSVKKNWFNGLPLPAIAVRRLSGRVELVKRFGYEDYLESLS